MKFYVQKYLILNSHRVYGKNKLKHTGSTTTFSGVDTHIDSRSALTILHGKKLSSYDLTII